MIDRREGPSGTRGGAAERGARSLGGAHHLRGRVFDRDRGICATCGRYDARWEADHIVARWEGGEDRLENLQTLCRRCHVRKTASDAPIRAKTDRLRERHETMKRRRSIG